MQKIPSDRPSDKAIFIQRAAKKTAMNLGSSHPPEPMLDAVISKENCLASLGKFDKIPDSLAPQLGIPEKICSVGQGALPSFSTDHKKSVAALSEFFSKVPRNVTEPTVPPVLLVDLPEYGVAISKDGSSFFCTLVDRRPGRSIIVFHEILPLPSFTGSRPDAWKDFETALDNATDISQQRINQGKAPGIVVSFHSRIGFMPSE